MNLAVLPRLALVLVLGGFLAADVAAQSLSRADGSTAARPSPPSLQTPQLPARSDVAFAKARSSAPRQARPLRFRGGDEVTLSHSASQAVVAETGAACPTGPNSYYRVFDLGDFDLGSGLEVTSVDLGIESVQTAGATTVNLHTLEGSFTSANLTQVGTATLEVTAEHNLQVVTVPISGSFDGTEVLVVEWAVPQTPVFFGGNSEGQTGPTYIRAEACGAAEPTDLAELDFAEAHWVLNVNGTVAGGGGDIVQDGSFEDGTPNQFWDEGSTAFGTPLCDEAGCGLGGGTGPFDGTWWTWFGGVADGDEGFVAQDVAIPSGPATLSFYLEISAAGQSGSMRVLLGGDELFSVTEADAGSYATYQRVTIDVSAYAGGGTHTLRFESTTQAGSAVTNFFVDLVEISTGADTPPPAPAGLTATAGDGEVALSWSAVSTPGAGYHVYRATAPFSAPGEATRLTSSPQTGTAYTDAAVTNGTRYYYRVSATTTSEGPLSNQADATPMSPRPPMVSASVNLVFGDPEQQQNYRLIALPGTAGVSLASTLTGSRPDNWRAFEERGSTGSEGFSHSECTGNCSFAPGEGFWLLADSPWSVSSSFPTVALGDGAAAVISVHPGWNLISNPLEVDVSWQSVQEANGLSRGLNRWNGAWVEASTFASARGGEAFYFFNDDRTTLAIPFPAGAQPDPAVAAARVPSEGGFELTLSGRVAGEELAVAAVSAAPDAAVGLDDHDRFAPPGYFEALGLVLVNDSLETAYRRLRHDARPAGAEGYQFEVVLTARPGAEVELVPELASAGAFEAVLVDPASAVRYELRQGEAVRLRAASPTTRYTLLVGSPAFVGASEALPHAHTVESYPNPFASVTTIRYGLPEAGRVRLAVYNVLGERVALLLDNEARDAGYHAVVWEPQNLASGIYFYVLEASAQRLTGKMTVVK